MGEIEFPIEITGIDFGDEQVYEQRPLFSPDLVGKFVSVRPCGEEYGDKTYLGIYLGDIALAKHVIHDKENKRLKFHIGLHNPAMFVFDLNCIIFGCGSFWGPIRSEEELRTITDDDIENVWYIKALKQMEEDTP